MVDEGKLHERSKELEELENVYRFRLMEDVAVD